MAGSLKSPEQTERLAAALRENLKRRKARARALAGHSAEEPPDAAQEPAPGPEKAAKTG